LSASALADSSAAMRYDFQPAAACNMCGGADFAPFGIRLNGTQGLRPRRATGIAVSIKKCRSCGLLFPDPMPLPEHLSDHYGMPPEDYWTGTLDWDPSYFSTEIATAKRLIDFQPGMRALDIGAGLGKCMKSLAAAKFDAVAIEPSEPFRDRALATTGLAPERIQLSTLEEAEFEPDSFDFITFGAVLEHLPDPSAAIAKAMRWLKPGGIIQAEVPSTRHLIGRLINLYYRLAGTTYVTNTSPMHSPFHLYEFTLDCFRRNGERLGYGVAEHVYMVCEILHFPRMLHPALRWWMARTGSGMQLTVYLRKQA
jgi:SAM-dependent methyltransferase